MWGGWRRGRVLGGGSGGLGGGGRGGGGWGGSGVSGGSRRAVEGGCVSAGLGGGDWGDVHPCLENMGCGWRMLRRELE